MKGGTGKEGDTGKETGADHGPYKEYEVDKQVVKIGGEAPEYPSSLRDSGVQGEVVAHFVLARTAGDAFSPRPFPFM